MERFTLEKTKSSPYVDLNPDEHKLLFHGQSYPENAYKLYEPIYQWIDEYFARKNDIVTTIEFFLSYINTSSTKCLLMLFEKLNQAYLEGNKIAINWYYDEENGYDYEMGQEFQEYVDLPFNFIPVSN